MRMRQKCPWQGMVNPIRTLQQPSGHSMELFSFFGGYLYCTSLHIKSFDYLSINMAPNSFSEWKSFLRAKFSDNLAPMLHKLLRGKKKLTFLLLIHWNWYSPGTKHPQQKYTFNLLLNTATEVLMWYLSTEMPDLWGVVRLGNSMHVIWHKVALRADVPR